MLLRSQAWEGSPGGLVRPADEIAVRKDPQSPMSPACVIQHSTTTTTQQHNSCLTRVHLPTPALLGVHFTIGRPKLSIGRPIPTCFLLVKIGIVQHTANAQFWPAN